MINNVTDDDNILKVTDLKVDLQDQVILDKISFEIKRGTSLAIIGPYGAGKTVLLKTLFKLIPYTGKIEWSNNLKIGYVPQALSAHGIPISVREFLSLKNKSKVEDALNSVGLDSKNIVDKGLGVLSGGQLRRVLIAWAIIDKPDVLLLDEPTTGVDIDSEEAIYEMLKRFTEANNITLILISHDIHIVREFSDYILALNKCIVFFGESEKIMNPDLQRQIYGEAHVCIYEPVVSK